MAVGLSDRAIRSLKRVVKTPNVVLEIEGLATPISARILYSVVRIGDDDLEIGDPELNPLSFYIGEGHRFQDQKSIINLAGSSSSIKQTLNIDKGEGSSVSSLTIEVQDDGYATKLITPGNLVEDLLARKCRVWMAPDENLYWPEDFGLVFRGIVSSIDAVPGKVTLALTAPESKKRSTIFKVAESKLAGGISSGATSIALSSSADLFQKVLGPDGTYDSSFVSYVQIEDEVIQFDSISGNTLIGCTRGALNTTAASHGNGEGVKGFYRLQGNPLYLALKIMLSGFQGPWVEDLPATAFVSFEALSIPNAIYFSAENVMTKYGVSIGDFVTTTGAINGANNISTARITDIQLSEDGTYIVVDGAGFVSETSSTAICSFRSQFDTLPDGLMMGGDEVDVDGHLTLFLRFFSSALMDFYLKEEINGREFLDAQIYLPISCFSVPRQAKASIGYHIGPLPGDRTFTLDLTNTKLAGRTQLNRSISRNFYNEIIYKFEQAVLEDKFKSGLITIAQDSKNQIAAGNKTLIIEAKGLRDALSGDNVAQQASNRKLKRYKYGAETIKLSMLFESGFDVEIGDIVIYDGTGDKLPDIKTGKRGIAPRLFEVQNKTLDLKNGDVQVDLIDTNFSLTTRYGLISPASIILASVSPLAFTIANDQARKWIRYPLASISVRDETGSMVSTSVIQSIAGGVVNVSPALSFVPTAGMILEFSHYDNANVTDVVKLKYAHMRDSAFADGKIQYSQL